MEVPTLQNNHEYMEQVEGFRVIGISVVTTNKNKNEKSTKDLKELWRQFFEENRLEQIPNKKDEEIHSIYADYESDYKGEYNSIIGLRANSLGQIHDGLVGREFSDGKYQKFTARGQMPNAVTASWKEIWSRGKELNRKYTADFEVYRQKYQNGKESEVEIYTATELNEKYRYN